MDFQPKTEKQILEEGLFPIGEYSFEILEAVEAVSKRGNQMIKLTLNVQNDQGGGITIFDYLMAAMPLKLRRCAEACNLLHKYDEGHLDAFDLQGKTGLLKLSVEQDKTGQYPDKNIVNEYLVKDAAQTKESQAPSYDAKKLDDDIPF